MKKLFILLPLMAALLMSGCASAQVKRLNTATQAAYAINDSLKAGRIDLARKYSDQLVRLAPPPKKKIAIKAIVAPVTVKAADGTTTTETKTLTILPEDLKNNTTIIRDSPDFTKLVAQNPTIAKQVASEDKDVSSFEKKTDDTLRAIEKEAEKPKSSGGIFGWILGGVGALGIGGMIILAIFFPAAIPLITNIFGAIIGFINSAIKGIANLFSKKTS